MPNRMLREGILESERVDKLSAEAEVFYRRLHSVVDDFARYYAKPELLIAACYPLRIGSERAVPLNLITRWLGDCEEAWLLVRYTVGGKEYLQLLDFRQQVRAKKSKFPHPPSDAQQVISTREASAHLDGDVGGDEDEDEGDKERKRSTTPPPTMELTAEDRKWAQDEGYAITLDAHLAYFNDFVAASGKRYKNVRAAFRNCVRSDWGDVRKRLGKGPSGPTLWKVGAEPDEVLKRVAREMQVEPWQEGETHGQFRSRIVDAGGEDLLKPKRAA